MGPRAHRHPGERTSRPARLLRVHPGWDSETTGTATEEGIRAASRALRREQIYEKGYGLRRSDWHRRAVPAYTWFRTDRGPQKSWLHRIGKSADATCPCSSLVENGDHITFICPRFNKERAEWLGTRSTWEELDSPVWGKEGDDDLYDAIEAFFHYMFSQFA